MKWVLAKLSKDYALLKSIKSIAVFVNFLNRDWPWMIIWPTSLKFNWKMEIKKWLTDIDEDKIMIIKKSKDKFPTNINDKMFYILSYGKHFCILKIVLLTYF